jgi:hypothetical protein
MSSTYSEIEDNYKRLVKEVHPQRNNKGNERYYEINSAYEILRDSYKREFYDLYGEQPIPILQNREVGFAKSRVLFRNNLLAFILLSTISISNLMFVPLYIYYIEIHLGHIFLVHNYFFIASCLYSLLTNRKNYGRMIVQLFKMIIVSTNLIIIATELFLACLYANRIINGLVGAIVVSLLELIQ